MAAAPRASTRSHRVRCRVYRGSRGRSAEIHDGRRSIREGVTAISLGFERRIAATRRPLDVAQGSLERELPLDGGEAVVDHAGHSGRSLVREHIGDPYEFAMA